jgi:probable HAF family extracellular repeat protein
MNRQRGRQQHSLMLERLETRCVLSTIIDLGTLGGLTSQAYGINASGQVVGQADTASGTTHAFLYSGDQMIDLGTLGGASSVAFAINSSGQVVGEAQTANGDFHAFLYNGGPLIDLGTLGGSESSALGIDDAGDIVGSANLRGDVLYHAFLLPNGGQMTDLGTFGGDYSYANGINANGQVVGGAETPNGDYRAFLYNGGPLIDLGTLGGSDGSATAINGAGQVVGEACLPGDAVAHAFLGGTGTPADLGTLGGSDSSADAINSAGFVVGVADPPGDIGVAFLWDGTTVTDLNTLIPPGAGWMLAEATGINDSNLIVGFGTSPNEQTHAFVVVPDSPPAPHGISHPLSQLVTAPPDPQSANAFVVTPRALTPSRPAAEPPAGLLPATAQQQAKDLVVAGHDWTLSTARPDGLDGWDLSLPTLGLLQQGVVG